MQYGLVRKTFETDKLEVLSLVKTGESEGAMQPNKKLLRSPTKPTELPNPKNNWVQNVMLSFFFPAGIHFSWVGIASYIRNRLQETRPNQIIGEHTTYQVYISVQTGIILPAKVVLNY